MVALPLYANTHHKRPESCHYIYFLNFFLLKRRCACLKLLSSLRPVHVFLCVNVPEGQRRKPATAKLDCLFSNVNVPKCGFPVRDSQPHFWRKKRKHPINHSVSVTDNLDLNSVTRLVRLCNQSLSRLTATAVCSIMALCWVVMTLGPVWQYNSVFVFHLSGWSSRCVAECFNSYCLSVGPKDTI